MHKENLCTKTFYFELMSIQVKKIVFVFTAFTFLYDAAAQSYDKIHFSAVICDTHNDILSTAIEKGYSFDNDLSGKTHSDLNRMFKAGIDVQVF